MRACVCERERKREEEGERKRKRERGIGGVRAFGPRAERERAPGHGKVTKRPKNSPTGVHREVEPQRCLGGLQGVP